MTKEERLNKIAELKEQAKEYKRLSDYYNAMQLALKKVLNGTYGAFANEYFVLFDNNVANAITAQGRNLTQSMYKLTDIYWYDKWHKDKKLHEKLCIKNVSQIPSTESVTIYGDTDSVSGDSVVDINDEKMTIKEWYDRNKDNEKEYTLKGHQAVRTSDKILNYDHNNNCLIKSAVRRIIRHKVSKDKWCLKTSGGKSITCTSDHSLIVFRDGVLISVKPHQILKTDKILVKD